VAAIAAVLALTDRQPAAAAEFPVEILVVPWAKVDRIAPLDRPGASDVELPTTATTPLVLPLPPGRYRAEVSNPDLDLRGSFDIVVSGNGPVRSTHVLEGFDPVAAFGEIVR
jgi:hypothetical protein